jgi:hypothetical protein
VQGSKKEGYKLKTLIELITTSDIFRMNAATGGDSPTSKAAAALQPSGNLSAVPATRHSSGG